MKSMPNNFQNRAKTGPHICYYIYQLVGVMICSLRKIFTLTISFLNSAINSELIKKISLSK